MKILLLFCTLGFATSCSTAYKSGQTPDDLYYSKAKVKVNTQNRYEAKTEVNNYENRQIRMQAYDYRWRSLDNYYDYNYAYNPYQYGYNYGYYYNPYYCPYPVYAPNAVFVNPKNTTIRKANLATYNNTIITNAPTKSNPSGKSTVIRGYNNNNTQSTRNNNYDNRVYTPSTNNSSNNSSNNNSINSSSNNTAPATQSGNGSSISRPSRGGN